MTNTTKKYFASSIKRTDLCNYVIIMKIGIFTFHWGTNYGAILQAFALQTYLTDIGHEVEIINYKPYQFDFSWFFIAKHPSLWKGISRALANRKKEVLLQPFREKYLNVTRRYGSINEFRDDLNKYDVFISGSDQILNPGFTIAGDNGKPSSAYWLGVGRMDALRIGYAVSFGCEKFPLNAAAVAKQWVNGFNSIGTREQTGLQILKHLDYKGKIALTPDPTILIGKQLFQKLGVRIPIERNEYTCVYMLRHEISLKGNIRYIDDKHNPLKMEEWLSTIINSKQLVTNSYHGMIMAILANVPFVVLLETGIGHGMNDRFITLLTKLDLLDRIVENNSYAIIKMLSKPIEWCKINEKLKIFRQEGVEYLQCIPKL